MIDETELSGRAEVQQQLDAIWPEGPPITLAMLEVELHVDPLQIDPAAQDPIPLTIQIELRQVAGEPTADYRARVRVGDDPWQDWQKAEPAIGAQALLDL